MRVRIVPDTASHRKPRYGNGTKKQQANDRLYRLCRSLPDNQIREAVLRCLPAPYSKANEVRRCLRKLARQLKATDSTAPSIIFRLVVDLWAEVADPGSAAPFADFATLYDAADGLSPTAFVDRIRRLIAADGKCESAVAKVTRAFQLAGRHFGRKRFFLSARLLERATGLSPATVARVVKRIQGVRLVRKGIPNPFTRIAAVYDIGGLLALCDPSPAIADPDALEDAQSPHPPLGLLPRPALGFSAPDDHVSEAEVAVDSGAEEEEVLPVSHPNDSLGEPPWWESWKLPPETWTYLPDPPKTEAELAHEAMIEALVARHLPK